MRQTDKLEKNSWKMAVAKFPYYCQENDLDIPTQRTGISFNLRQPLFFKNSYCVMLLRYFFHNSLFISSAGRKAFQRPSKEPFFLLKARKSLLLEQYHKQERRKRKHLCSVSSHKIPQVIQMGVSGYFPPQEDLFIIYRSFKRVYFPILRIRDNLSNLSLGQLG